MPLRKRLKQGFKEFKDDVKNILKRKDRQGATATGSSSPSTPVGGTVGNLGGGAPGVPSLAQVLADPPVAQELDQTLRRDNNLESPPEPTGPASEGDSGIADASASTPETSFEPTGNNEATPTGRDEIQPQVAALGETEVISGHTESDESGATPEQTPPSPMENVLTGQGLKTFATGVVGQVVDTLKIGPLKDVSDMLQGFADMYKMEGAVKKDYEALRLRLEPMLQDLDGFLDKDSTITPSVESLRRSVEGELNFIRTKQSKSRRRRYIEAKDEADEILACYRRIEGYLGRLALNANISILKLAEEQSKHTMFARVRCLPFPSSACYDSRVGEELKRRECTPGTRVSVLANLLGWAKDQSKGAVYWLSGMAGTGKTTIAYSVCKELNTELKLAASFFCSRLREECRNVNTIIPSIAYQLAQFSHPFQSALSAAIERDPDAHTKRLDIQFKALIEEPLLLAKPTLPEGLVVLIDALDECESRQSTEDVLDVLLNKAANVPLKFIVSSRPEPQIRDQMTDERVKSRLVLHELDAGEVRADIEKYLREALAQINPSDAHIEALVERAGILFIYAATVVRYISYSNFRNSDSRLRVILNGSQTHGTTNNEEIDRLYATILEASLGDEGLDEDERDEMRQVLFTVVCAREPLTVSGLSELLQINSVKQVRAALDPLWSVLYVVGETEVVTTLHASFPDFMFDPTRSKIYHCDPNSHHRKLAQSCFERIERTQPEFNICGLQSSYLHDANVPDMEDRIARVISSGLLYACRYWADHVKIGNSLSLIDPLQSLLSTRILLWMEVLNLSKQITAARECMRLAVEWCNFVGHQELAELARDAKRFVDAFASNPVSQSTPHIYVSMMAFWPKSAPITKYYARFTQGPIQAEGTALARRQLAYLSTWKFDKGIHPNAMVMSPDGSRIALGVGADLLLVDSSSGRTVRGPLRGHTEMIRSVVFSPDGKHILSVAHDGPHNAAVIGWDVRTGVTILGPVQLVEDTSPINFIRFSPDSTCIATGSYDNIVRLWDTQTGKMLRCMEAQGSVDDAVFSPDGTRIAARFNETYQVWCSQTGNGILGPFLHTQSITAIAFSPDNTRIICGSQGDYALHVWDTQSGNIIIGPIEGHKAYIWYIGCSPDGRLIVSGSYDQTIRIWDAQNGNLLTGPLEGHTGAISSLIFSVDGSCLISGCTDGLVCTWDARQHNLTPQSATIPSDHTTCLKFCSDGTRFVSGSKEGTISIRDAHTGEMTLGRPIRVHSHQITAVDFLNNRVVSGSTDGKICVIDARSGEVILGPLGQSALGVGAVAYAPDGKMIAVASACYVSLVDAEDGSWALGPNKLPEDIISVQFSPDGTRLVAASWTDSSNIAIWYLSGGVGVFETFCGYDRPVRSMTYSPNGAFIALGSDDHTITILDAYTQKKVLDPLTGHSGSVRSVDFSPDTTHLVSGSEDNTIRVWDVRTGNMIFKLLHGHESWITSVAYSPDGTRILTLSDDMSMRIHDARSPSERALAFSTSEVGDWTINKDGWIVDDQSKLLGWVPGDLRKALMWSNTQVMVAPQGHVRLIFHGSRIGKSWTEGYTSHM